MKLESIRFINQCAVPWESMQGGERVRRCSTCNRHVFNLSAMPREEAEAFVDRTEGRECLAFWKRPDGTIVSGDCRESEPPAEECHRMLGVPAIPK